MKLVTILTKFNDFRAIANKYHFCRSCIRDWKRYSFKIAAIEDQSCLVVCKIKYSPRDLLVEWQGCLISLLEMRKKIKEIVGKYRNSYAIIHKNNGKCLHKRIAARKAGFYRVRESENYFLYMENR